jgi:SSS family solute:Na+ symporter
MSFFLDFQPVGVDTIDLVLIFIYLAGILLFGIYIGRGVHTSEDFFVAGKSLPFWIVGLSIIGSNIGSNDYVGASGQSYEIGIAQANFEWIGAIPAMILCAFFFIPYYWKAGVYSIPEFMGLRYTKEVRVLSALILSCFSLLSVGVYLWSTALILKTYLGWSYGFSIFVTAFVIGIYTVTGGLKAVAMTDGVQVGIMFIGSMSLAFIGIEKAGGLAGFWNELETKYPNHLHAFLPMEHPSFPWPGVLLGLSLVLSPAYWCTNQVILQRTLGARSLWDSQASLVFAAIFKTFVPFLIVLPGLLVLVLNPTPLSHKDQALGWAIKNLLPPGLSGLLFIAFISALQSSIDSTLNSTATMVTRDIIGVLKKEKLNSSQELKLGKGITIIGLIFGILIAPFTQKFSGIYELVQTALSFFQGPIFSLMLFGIISKIPTPKAGLITLVLGVLFSIFLSFLQINILYIAFISFTLSTISLFIISKFTKKQKDEILNKLTFGGKFE